MRHVTTTPLQAASHSFIRKAAPGDESPIHAVIAAYAEEGILLPRTMEEIAASLDRFLVYELAGTIIGTITFCDYGESLVEVRSLAVKKGHLTRGIGSALLRALIRDLTATGNPRIFVLTYAVDFFIKNGFTVIDIDTLPEKIWKDCVNCKNWDTCSEVALEYRSSSSLR